VLSVIFAVQEPLKDLLLRIVSPLSTLLQVQTPSPSTAVPSSKPGQGKSNKVDPDEGVISVFHKSVRDWFTNDEHERNAVLVNERQGHALLCKATIHKLYSPHSLQQGGATAGTKPLAASPSAFVGTQLDVDPSSSYRSLPAFASSPPVYERGLTVRRQSSMPPGAGGDKRDSATAASVMLVPSQLAVEEVLSALNLSSTSPSTSASSSSSLFRYSMQYALVHACLSGDVVSMWSLVCSMPYMELRTQMGQTQTAWRIHSIGIAARHRSVLSFVCSSLAAFLLISG
jgi:hypothetical protein